MNLINNNQTTLYKSVFGTLLICMAFSCGKTGIPEYKEPVSSVENRVKDLLGRMTLEEKVAQTYYVSAELFIKNNEVDTVKLDSIIKHGIGEIRDYFVTYERNSVRINNLIQKHLSGGENPLRHSRYCSR